MFFICGINPGQKELPFNQLVICNCCGSYGRYQIFMTYMSLSLFFIPILRWGKHYYVKMSCCNAVYELSPDLGKRIARGEQVEIAQADLHLVKSGTRNPWQTKSGIKRICPNCGYETEENFSYCPKCGGKLS